MTQTDDSGLPPAYASSSDSPVALTVTGNPEGKDILISLSPPKEPSGQNALVGNRAPVDFVLVIDVSGSMEAAAPAPGENETNDLTVLDVVKHSVRTIVTSMKDSDRVAIVTFSNSAKVVCPMSRTTEDGKKKVMEIVERLQTEDSTNLWEGLKTGMSVLTSDEVTGGLIDLEKLSFEDDKKSDLPLTTQRVSAVFLLTDGMPNNIPPRGHIPMLTRFLESLPPSRTKFTINTFGFGYSLDSQLLHDIAAIGKGTYGFIPDSGMVGTVFVHATANAYATYAQGCEINVEVSDEETAKSLEVLGGLEVARSSWGVKIDLGAVQYGQTKDVVVRLPKSIGKTNLTVTANYRPWWTPSSSPSSSIAQSINSDQLPQQPDLRVLHHSHRLTFVQEVLKLFPKNDSAPSHHRNKAPATSQDTLNETGKILNALAKTIQNDFTNVSDSYKSLASDALDLAKDIEGEVVLALDYDEKTRPTATNFNKWGRHYLPSLARSHQRQQCSNFKDAGLQVYGRDSPLFVKSRDEMDALFDSLPPPTPSGRGAHRLYSAPPGGSALHGGAAPRIMVAPPTQQQAKGIRGMLGFGAVAKSALSPSDASSGTAYSSAPAPARKSMASWNKRSAPCFAGHCLVTTAGPGARHVRVDQLKRGMAIQTPAGPRSLAAIVRTVIPDGQTEMCSIGEGLVITPWHPINSANGEWVFPAQVIQPQVIPCNEVFSLLLEPDRNSDSHAVWIGGVLCVTLGHGIIKGDDVRSHAFFGDYSRVARSLLDNPDFSNEDGVLTSYGTIKSEQTGLVNGFAWEHSQEKDILLQTKSAIYC